MNKIIWKTIIDFIITVVWLLVTIVEVILALLIHPFIWMTAGITVVLTIICIIRTIYDFFDINSELNKVEINDKEMVKQFNVLVDEYQELKNKLEELEKIERMGKINE